MVITRLIGGLGNQMFQYAIGRRLALDLGVRLIVDVTAFKQYTLHPPDILNYRIHGIKMSRGGLLFDRVSSLPLLTRILGLQVRGEKSFSFDSAAIGAAREHVFLTGYWQTERYFSKIRSTLVEDFQLKNSPDANNEEFLRRIVSVPSVSLHIRRGDYVSNPNAAAVHGVIPLSYYHEAMRDIETREPEVHYFVFSDDPEWASKNLQSKRPMEFVSHNESKGFEDLRLMSACRHQIIANSTFSWWGAWLNCYPHKRIYAPDPWFKDKSLNATDLLPKEWQRVPC